MSQPDGQNGAPSDATLGPTDDEIDALCERALGSSGDATLVPALLQALSTTKVPLLLRSSAIALAVVAKNDDESVADALCNLFCSSAKDVFLAPAILEAWGLFALRSPLARAALTVELQRLKPTYQRYLLIKAAKIIGRIYSLAPLPELRQRLQRFSESEDLAVQAEAHQQLALICLADALRASDYAQLHEQLACACAGFRRAEQCEECRPDASIFVCLLDVLLEFYKLADQGNRNSLIDTLDRVNVDLEKKLCSYHFGAAYQAETDKLLIRHALKVAHAIRKSAAIALDAEQWTNFSEAMTELALCYICIKEKDLKFGIGKGPLLALSNVADVIVVPQIGPILRKHVSVRRMKRIIDDYAQAHGQDEITEALYAFERAAKASVPTDITDLNPQLEHLAAQLGLRPEALIVGFQTAISNYTVDIWMEQLNIAKILPVQQPTLYGRSAQVDTVVRHLLTDTRKRLTNTYSLEKWNRLRKSVEEIVQIAHRLRDELPDYMLCQEDGGLGQQASEHNLQEDLWKSLRSVFGADHVHYEPSRIAGGRSDLSLIFEESTFPIEVKHEFRSIEPEHIHNNYIIQPADYAAVRDGVAFLLVLDLRSLNGAGHRKRRQQQMATALYSLGDSFWIDQLSADPHLPGKVPPIVITGIVPGNRRRPSSTTAYSQRPATARLRRRSHIP